jgi:hypothetical protein
VSGRGDIAGVIPAPNSPIADVATGAVTVAWRAWFIVLQRRTGGNTGISTTDNAALVAVERAARIAADNGFQTALNGEAAAREAAVAAEEAARIAGDAYLAAIDQGTQQGLANEVLRATAAEALLVPLDQLCSLWATCDLSFLPTADPGNGMPWLDGNHIAIGSSSTVLVDLGLEDATGRWALEDGTGAWLWG